MENESLFILGEGGRDEGREWVLHGQFPSPWDHRVDLVPSAMVVFIMPPLDWADSSKLKICICYLDGAAVHTYLVLKYEEPCNRHL